MQALWGPKGPPRHIVRRMAYFFLFGFKGALDPFLPVFLADMAGLGPVQIGAVASLMPVASMVASSTVCGAADKYQRHLRAATTALLLSLLGRFAVLLVPPLPFVLIIVVLLAKQAADAPLAPLLDGATLTQLPDPLLFGRERLWGAVGFGLAVLATGVTTDASSLWVALATVPVLYGIGTSSLVAVVASAYGGATAVPDSAPATPAEDGDGGSEGSEEGVEKGTEAIAYDGPGVAARLAAAALKPTGLAFFAVVLACGVATGCIETFLFVHVEALGGSKTLMGAGRAITCLSELPFFFHARPLIRRLGTFGVLHFAMTCYVLRLLVYATATAPAVILLVEPLHGVTYALLWAASTAHARRIAPPGLIASMQGLLSAVKFGGGVSLGAFLGGLLYRARGGSVLFASAAVMVAVALLLSVATQAALRVSRGGRADVVGIAGGDAHKAVAWSGDEDEDGDEEEDEEEECKAAPNGFAVVPSDVAIAAFGGSDTTDDGGP